MIEAGGYRFPVVEISCRYLHSARYGDEVSVRAYLLRETVARLHCIESEGRAAGPAVTECIRRFGGVSIEWSR